MSGADRDQDGAPARSGALVAPVPAPAARRDIRRREDHGRVLEDPYAWLRDPAYPEVGDPEILAHLEAENAYFEAVMGPHGALVDALYHEIKGRQPLEDASVPSCKGAWRYQWRFEAEAQYRTWVRWPRELGDEPGDADAVQTILDEPERARGLEYYRMGGLAVSPDGRHVAWSEDTDGSERFTLRIKDLRSGRILEDETIPGTLGAPVWCADSVSFLYLVLTENWRPNEVRLHQLGHPVADDASVYKEADESFFVGIDKTTSEAWLLITASDHVTSEARLLPADDPLAQPRLVAPRRTGHEYDVDHGQGRFWIRTNDRHVNFRLVSAPESAPDEANWSEVLAGGDDRYLTGFASFARFLVTEERHDGLDQIRILEAERSEHLVAFPEASYAAGLGSNPEYDTDFLRIGYESMVTPGTVYDYPLGTRELVVRKVQRIPSGYDASAYETERLLVPVRDGVRVPVSVVRRRDLGPGPHPLYLYGYGAYGLAMEPGFSTARLSLLDRGFAFAIAHIRGGDDLGYRWYLDGKLDKRTNTFHDFVDVARHLIERGDTAPGLVTASGGSAGGELMGAALNEAPELFGAVAAHVPFVDVLATMLDETLPLTPMEWPEWGNPLEDPAAYDCIAAYSPYDNVEPRAYPPLLVTAGLNDPRVTYWEPAKWVAKLRHEKTDRNVVLLKTNMGAGHGGRSGRFEALREIAEEYAFLLLALDRA